MNTDITYGKTPKTIRKILRSKITEWLTSITDETLRTQLEKEVIVTGGSIASMLIGQPVNDYDLYLKTKATTIAAARYYVQKFNSNKKIKVAEGVTEYEPYVDEKKITNCKGIEEDRVVIYIKSAGVASETQDTYQYFEAQPDDVVQQFVASLNPEEEEGKEKYRPIFLSTNAITLSNSIQLVIRFYGNPDEIHDNFDFAHAMSYYDYAENNLVLPNEALTCLLSKTLKYKGSLYPICSLFRTKKFLERGWRISAGEQLKMAWQISELDMKNVEVLQEQLTGCDAAYMHQLLTALKSVEADKINSCYIAEIIDRIFG